MKCGGKQNLVKMSAVTLAQAIFTDLPGVMLKLASCVKFQLQNQCSHMKRLVQLKLKPVLVPFFKSYRRHGSDLCLSLRIVFNLQQIWRLLLPVCPVVRLCRNLSRPATSSFLRCGEDRTFLGWKQLWCGVEHFFSLCFLTHVIVDLNASKCDAAVNVIFAI